jgi:RHS repeat-associated protein
VPLALDLTYHSISSRLPGQLGSNWYHTYEWTLSNLHETDVFLHTGNGKRFMFTRNEDGSFISPESNNWTLEKVGDFYHLIQPAAFTYIFDPAGTLRRIQDSWGTGLTCYYEQYFLAEVKHDNGRQLLFQNVGSASHQRWYIYKIIVPERDAKLIFSYDSKGHLRTIKERDGDALISQSTYTYDRRHNLTNKVNRAGYEYDYTYHESGKAHTLHADGFYPHHVSYAINRTDVIYTARGATQVNRYQRSNDNSQLLFEYGPAPGSAHIHIAGKQFAYNDNDDKTMERQFDLQSQAAFTLYKAYDDQHNLTNLATAYSTDVTDLDLLDETPIQQMAYTYSNNLLIATLEPDGSRTEFAYTNSSISQLRAYFSPDQSYDTHFRYNDDGQLTHTITALGHTNTLIYTPVGDLETILPAAGPITRYTYDGLGFTRTAETLTDSGDSTGRITTFERDALGRTTRTLFADGHHEQLAYNGLGDITQRVDRAGRKTDYEHVPTAITGTTRYLQEGGTSTPVRIGYDLDELTHVLRIAEPAGRYVESYRLDIKNRIHNVTNIENQVQTYFYTIGDRIREYRRFDRTIITNAYDAAGRLSDTFYPDTTLSRSYHADNALHTLSEIDPAGEPISSMNYTNDLLNRPIKQTAQNGNRKTRTFTHYDAVGNIRNTRVVISWDEGWPWHSINIGRTHDAAGRITSQYQNHYTYSPENGRLSTLSNSVSGITSTYEYDLLNQLTNLTYTAQDGSTLKAIGYERNAVGMITKKIQVGLDRRASQHEQEWHSIPSTNVTHYTYDSLDRLVNETTEASSISYRYDLAGNRTAKINNGRITTYALGAGNRLATVSTASTNLLFVSGISDELIGLDNRWGTLYVTNLTTQAGIVPDVNGHTLSTLIPALEGATNIIIAAVRDQAGNTTFATNAYWMPPAETPSIPPATYAYDPAGCLTNRNAQTLAWDSRYRLTSVTNADTSVVSYSYDVLNRKISRTANGSTEHYAYAGPHIIADLRPDKSLKRVYQWGAGIDNLLSFTTYTTGNKPIATYFPLKDQLNSILCLVTADGTVVESYEYDAYGNTKIFDADGKQLDHSAIGNRYMFQGREYDEATKLYNFRARWYDPETGRWLSKDPIGIAGGLNQYIFIGNNPVNFRDPSGLRAYVAPRTQGNGGRVTGYQTGTGKASSASEAAFGATTALGDAMQNGNYDEILKAGIENAANKRAQKEAEAFQNLRNNGDVRDSTPVWKKGRKKE